MMHCMNLELLIECITAVLRISFKILNLIHSNHSVSDNAGHYSHQRNYSLSSRGRGCMAPVKLAIELFFVSRPSIDPRDLWCTVKVIAVAIFAVQPDLLLSVNVSC